jgi:hypothetical protein
VQPYITSRDLTAADDDGCVDHAFIAGEDHTMSIRQYYGAAVAALCSLAFSSSALAEPSAAPAAAPTWEITTTTSALDNKTTYAAALNASNVVFNSLGHRDDAALIVRCSPGGLESYVAFPSFMDTSSVRVSYRLDQDAVVTASWTPSKSGMSLGFFGSAGDRPFLDKLALAKRLVVRSPRYQSSDMEVVFDLGDVARVVADAEKACS